VPLHLFHGERQCNDREASHPRAQLKRCGDNFTRDNVMKVVTNLDFEIDSLIPGIRVKTSQTDFYPIEQVQMTRFTGERWQPFGPILDGHAEQVAPSSN
jgi:branched-chain amino acid transport system substrate-binding protein